MRTAAIKTLAAAGGDDHDATTDSTETLRKRRKTGQQSLLDMISKVPKEGLSTDPIIVESDEEMDSSGWVRKKTMRDKSDDGRTSVKKNGAISIHLLRHAFDWSKNSNGVLRHFRVDIKALR